MGIQQKHVTVNGVEYELTQLGALEGHTLWLRILKTLTAVVSSLSSQEELNEMAIAKAAAALIEHLDEDTYKTLCAAFAKKCAIRNGDKWPQMSAVIFDDHFAGNYVAMSQWLGECLMFNFANFSGDASLGQLLATVRIKAAAAMASKSKSPSSSTGTLGAS